MVPETGKVVAVSGWTSGEHGGALWPVVHAAPVCTGLSVVEVWPRLRELGTAWAWQWAHVFDCVGADGGAYWLWYFPERTSVVMGILYVWGGGVWSPCVCIFHIIFLGRSQQYRGPAWSNPVTSKGKAWLTLSAGKGAIGCEQACASWRWQEMHAFLTCLAMRLRPIIQNSLRKEDIICGTPACFNKRCWNLVKRTLKWHLGRIMGCFSAWDNAENCNRPCIRNKPSSPRNGVNLASADVLGIGRPSFKALISTADSCCCTLRMSWYLAHFSSSKVKSLVSCLSTRVSLRLLMYLRTQATTRIALVKLPHLSTSNILSLTSRDCWWTVATLEAPGILNNYFSTNQMSSTYSPQWRVYSTISNKDIKLVLKEINRLWVIQLKISKLLYQQIQVSKIYRPINLHLHLAF